MILHLVRYNVLWIEGIVIAIDNELIYNYQHIFKIMLQFHMLYIGAWIFYYINCRELTNQTFCDPTLYLLN